MDRVQAFRGLIRVSGLGNCPRPLGYRVLEVGPDPGQVGGGEENPRFRDGHYHEWDIKRRLIDDGVRFISGLNSSIRVNLNLYRDFVVSHGSRKIDAVISIPPENKYPSGTYIGEMKSMATGYFWKFVKGGYRIAFPSYFAQIQGELFSTFESYQPITTDDTPFVDLYRALGAVEVNQDPTGLILPDKAMVFAKNKESGRIHYEVIEADEAYFVGLSKRWRRAEDEVEKGELPDRLHDDDDNYECAQCPWRSKCWGAQVEVHTASQAIILNEEVRPAAEAYAVGKKLSEIGESIMDANKEALVLTAKGSTKIGPVKVTAFETKRAHWNHKRLKEILTPTQLDEVYLEKTSLTHRRDVDTMTNEEIMELVRKLKAGSLPLLTSGEDHE